MFKINRKMGQKCSRVFNRYVGFRKFKLLFTGHISWWVFMGKSNSSSVLDPIKAKDHRSTQKREL